MSDFYLYSQASADVMTRVLFLYRLKRVLFSPLTRAGVLVSFFVVALFTVSLPAIIANTSQTAGLLEALVYLWRSFLHTAYPVQIIAVALLFFGVLLARDLVRYFHLQPFWLFRRLGF